jgi:hypothetical protein
MNSRRASIIVGVVLALTTVIPTSGKADDKQNENNHANAVSDAFVNFGSPQRQPTPVQIRKRYTK